PARENRFPPFIYCRGCGGRPTRRDARAPTRPTMKNFLRVVKLTLSRRFTFAAAVVCAIGVAFFWGGNLALIKPVITIVFSDKKPHELVDHQVDLAKEKLAATENRLAEAEAELAAAPAEQQPEVKTRRDRLAWQREIEERKLTIAEWVRPLVHQYVPNDK